MNIRSLSQRERCEVMFTTHTLGLHLAWLFEWIEYELRLPEGVSDAYCIACG